MLLRNSGDMKQVQWNIVENHDEDQGRIVYNKISPYIHKELVIIEGKFVSACLGANS